VQGHAKLRYLGTAGMLSPGGPLQGSDKMVSLQCDTFKGIIGIFFPAAPLTQLTKDRSYKISVAIRVVMLSASW